MNARDVERFIEMPFFLAGIIFLYFTFYELAISIIYDPAE